MLGNLTGWHMVIILVIILLLFGAPKLPGLAKSIGQSMRIFKGEVKNMKDDDEKSDSADKVNDTVDSQPATTTTSSESRPKQ